MSAADDWPLDPGAGLGCLLCGPPGDAIVEGLATAAREKGWSVCLATDLARGDHREAGREIEAGLKRLAQVEGAGADPLLIVGVGSSGTAAFLQACRSRRVGALAIVDVPLILDALDAQRPVQPLEMLLNLDVPLLRVESMGPSVLEPEHSQRVDLQLDAFSRDHQSHRIPSADLRSPLVFFLLEAFLSTHLETLP